MAATYLDRHPSLVTDPVDKHRLQGLIRDVLQKWKCAHKVETAHGDERYAVIFSGFPGDGSVDLTIMRDVIAPERPYLRSMRLDWSEDGSGVIIVRIEVARNIPRPGHEESDDEPDDAWTFTKYRDSVFGELLDETIDDPRTMGEHWPKTRERLIALAHAIQNQERYMPVRPSRFIDYPTRGTAALDTANMGHVTYGFLRHLTGIVDVIKVTATAQQTLRVLFEPRTVKPVQWPRLGGRGGASRTADEAATGRENKRART